MTTKHFVLVLDFNGRWAGITTRTFIKRGKGRRQLKRRRITYPNSPKPGPEMIIPPLFDHNLMHNMAKTSLQKRYRIGVIPLI